MRLRLHRPDLRLWPWPWLWSGLRAWLGRPNLGLSLRASLIWSRLRKYGLVFRWLPHLRLVGSVEVFGPSAGLGRTDSRLCWFYVGSIGFGLDGSRGLNLRTIVRLAGSISRLFRANLWLTWTISFSRSRGGLYEAVVLWSAGWIRSSDAGLRCDWSGGGDHRRTTTIDVIELLAVFRGRTLMLDLCAHGRRTGTAEGLNFGRLRTNCDAATTSVVGYAGIVDDHGAVINVSDVGVHSIDRSVVVEVVSVPVTAVIAISGVTEAIVDPSIEADMSTPVATEESPMAVVPTPVARGPQSPEVRRKTPGAGNPVVACGCPVPVARGPDVVWPRSLGLIVFWERWRRLIGIFNRLSLAFSVELVEGLGVLVGLILSGCWRGSRLIRSRLLGILFRSLHGLGLRAGC